MRFAAPRTRPFQPGVRLAPERPDPHRHASRYMSASCCAISCTTRSSCSPVSTGSVEYFGSPRVCARPPRGHDAAHPCDERVRWWNLLSQVRELEVCVSVDQAWHEHHRAKVFFVNRSRPVTSNRHNAVAIHVHPSIAKRRRSDGHDPGRAVANHDESTRSFLPARLRAG